MEKARLDWAKHWLSEEKTSYVGGEWRRDGASEPWETLNPATGEKLARLHGASASDVDRAVTAANAAFESGPWRRMTRKERAEAILRLGALLREHRAELATLESLDNGKLYREAYDDDLPEAADVFGYYAGWIDKIYGETAPVEEGYLNYIRREPVGVCALVVPWNFPLLLACWKIAPALAMGNTAIVKPSPFCSLSLVRFFELVHEAKVLPPGVLNLVLGGEGPGAGLARHRGVHKISFTGSTGVGKKVASASAESNLKTVTLELGGKSPNIVFDDAPDVDFAIERSFTAMFSHKGEKCSEPTRLFVQRGLYGRFKERLAVLAEAVVCGDPFDPESTQGAQCNVPQLEKIMGYIATGKQEGARLVAGGERDTRGGNARGLFVRPTVFADVDNRMKIARDEIFGPVLSVLPFSTEEEAVTLANDTPFGLAAGLWTRDLSRAHRVAERLDAGQIFVNRYGCYDFASPFGGFRESGWGKEMALHSLDSYTKRKSVWVKI